MVFGEEFELITVSEIPSESFIPGGGWRGHSKKPIHVRMPFLFVFFSLCQLFHI